MEKSKGPKRPGNKWFSFFTLLAFLWDFLYYFMLGFIFTRILQGVLDARAQRFKYRKLMENTKKTFAKQKALSKADKDHWQRLKNQVRDAKRSEFGQAVLLVCWSVVIYCLSAYIPKYHPYLAQFRVKLVPCCMMVCAEVVIYSAIVRPLAKDD